jgi:hypothetical protein
MDVANGKKESKSITEFKTIIDQFRKDICGLINEANGKIQTMNTLIDNFQNGLETNINKKHDCIMDQFTNLKHLLGDHNYNSDMSKLRKESETQKTTYAEMVSKKDDVKKNNKSNRHNIVNVQHKMSTSKLNVNSTEFLPIPQSNSNSDTLLVKHAPIYSVPNFSVPPPAIYTQSSKQVSSRDITTQSMTNVTQSQPTSSMTNIYSPIDSYQNYLQKNIKYGIEPPYYNSIHTQGQLSPHHYPSKQMFSRYPNMNNFNHQHQLFQDDVYSYNRFPNHTYNTNPYLSMCDDNRYNNYQHDPFYTLQ